MNPTTVFLNSMEMVWGFILNPENLCYTYYKDFVNPDKDDFCDGDWILISEMPKNV